MPISIAVYKERKWATGMKPIRLFYFREKNRKQNFGDALSPLLLERVLERPVQWAHPRDCQIAAIGSILESTVRKSWQRPLRFRFQPIEIWGSGTIRPGGQLSTRNVNINAVRGRMTLNRVLETNVPTEIALGDPALLCPHFFPTSNKTTYEWALIPHLSDQHLPKVRALLGNTPNCRIIDLESDVTEVIYTASQAEFIASSSLHGIVLATALGKPFVHINLSDKVAGGNWKFDDFTSAFHAIRMSHQDTSEIASLRQLSSEAQLIPLADVARLQDGLIKAANVLSSSLL
ncbi:MAG: polysaccharide pyruvyl transferase family protein [Pseudomonadota bacterium]